MSIELIFKDIEDEYSRENFSRIADYIKKDEIRKPTWTFFEITFLTGGTNVRYEHRLGYMPKDIIVTAVSDNENVVFNYDLFSTTHLDMSPSAACTVRFFAGSYR